MENQNMEDKVYTVPGPDGKTPIFVKESEMTHEQIGFYIKKMVEVYNQSPILARDYFTKGLISSVGITEDVLAAIGLQIDLSVPEGATKPQRGASGLII